MNDSKQSSENSLFDKAISVTGILAGILLIVMLLEEPLGYNGKDLLYNYSIGQKVTIKNTDQPAVITERSLFGYCTVMYTDQAGRMHTLHLRNELIQP